VDTAKADLLRLIVDLPKYLDGDYKNSLDNNNKFLATASLGSYKASFDKVWPLDADGKNVFDTTLKDIVKSIEGSTNFPSVTNALNILQNSKKYGMATLELDRKQLNTLTSAYSKGEDISLYSKDLSSLATDLDGSKRILGLSASIRNDFDALRKLTERQYTKEQTNSELISPMQKLLGTINAALGSLQELDSVK
jgi:hypothetical protein